MGENLFEYWKSVLENEEDIKLKKEGYVVNCTVINQYSNDGVALWVNCESKEKLYALLRYVILPSVQLSRTTGMIGSEVYLDVIDTEEVINVIRNSKVDGYEKAIIQYENWVDELSRIEKNDFELDKIRKYLMKITCEIDHVAGVYVELDCFENVKSIGSTLIEDYKKDDTLEILEMTLDLKENEIIALFESVDEDESAIQKIEELLYEKFI